MDACLVEVALLDLTLVQHVYMVIEWVVSVIAVFLVNVFPPVAVVVMALIVLSPVQLGPFHHQNFHLLL